MRDLALLGFLLGFIALGFRRPFLFVLAYAYVDIVAPQRLAYHFLSAIPVSLIVFVLAFGGWLLVDDKRGLRVAPRQIVLTLLLLWCFYTTIYADFPVEAQFKWDWVWKVLLFAIFLPFTLTTRLRIEALALVTVLSVASLVITGGIKTLAGGGGYGTLQLLVDDNSGLYEGSIISTVAIAMIPLVLWLARHSTVFPSDWRVTLFAAALVFACLLIPIGTQARTGLICIGVLALCILRTSRYRFAWMGLGSVALLLAVPFLPSAFTERMETIRDYRADESASTRVAVWGWTWDYALDNPFGGGFEAYLQNRLRYDTVDTRQSGAVTEREFEEIEDQGRAYHSAYFEMLGEQGFVGLALWLMLHIGGLVRTEAIRRRYRSRDGPDDRWIAPLATALQNAQIIYLAGALFVGIAFQPVMYMFVAMQIGLDGWLARRRKAEDWRPFREGAEGTGAGNPVLGRG